MNESKKLRRSLITAALALLAALFSVTAATFAWYIYNTSARTTQVKMAAGSSVSLVISNARDGEYKSSTVMEDFKGLLTPVSTDKFYPSLGEGHLKWNNYGAVPQALDDVQLVITTPDHNQYTVTMKDVVATSISETNVRYPAYTDNKVDRWYPGVKYTYRFKLTKKGITDLKATILKWETITAGKDDVQIQ